MAHNEEILREMVDAVEGQVENLEDQIGQINQRIEEIEGEISVIENTVMTKAANELIAYLDSTTIPQLELIYGGGCSVVTGSHYNDITNINSSNLTNWAIIDATANVIYQYLGIGWDNDSIITKYISDWDFGKDYLIHPLITFDGTYGIYPNIDIYTKAKTTIEGSKNKISDSEEVLGDYI